MNNPSTFPSKYRFYSASAILAASAILSTPAFSQDTDGEVHDNNVIVVTALSEQMHQLVRN